MRPGTDQLRGVDTELVADRLQTIPSEWKVPRTILETLPGFLRGRAKYVADGIERQLFRQYELFDEDHTAGDTQ